VRTICIHKAQDSGESKVDSLTIELHVPTPSLDSLAAQAAVHDSDARNLATALREHLPVGAYHRLIGYLCQQNASDMLISMAAPTIDVEVTHAR
jgi:hypothetical protein